MGSRTPWLGLLVATLLVGLGLTEGTSVTRGGASGATGATGATLPVAVLVGGGLLVLAGTILQGVLPWSGLVLTALGCGASIPAALWTVFVPLLLVALFVLRAWQIPAPAPAGRHALPSRQVRSTSRSSREASARISRSTPARVEVDSGSSSCSASTRSRPASGSAVASSLPTSRSPCSTGMAQ